MSRTNKNLYAEDCFQSSAYLACNMILKLSKAKT